MNSGKPGSAPTLGQMLTAALLGVLIGLIIVQFTRHPLQIDAPGVQLASKSDFSIPGVSDALGSLSKISLMPQLDRKMTLLVMGVDSNGRNTQRFLNTRSDTMMLVHCDPFLKKVGVVSIPRDSRVKLAGNHGIDKINSAHALGGPQLAVETTREYFAVPIDRYIVVDVQGLRGLFEALGPVEVLVEKKMYYRDRAAGLHVDLKPGLQMLDPKQAEEYVRFRHDPRGDIGRIERQQWFVRQVSKKLREPAVILKLPQLFKLANEYVVTDLTMDEMAKLASFGKDIEPSQVETALLPGHAEFIHGGSYWIPDCEGCSVVFSRVLGTSPSVAAQSEKMQYYGSDAATAATSLEPRKVSLLIRYPKGQETQARNLESAFSTAGYRVRYLIRGDLADCQHEQIVQNSYRADEVLTQQLKEKFPELKGWPIVVNVEPHSAVDFTVVLSPTSQFTAPEMKQIEAADEPQTEDRTRI